MILKTTSEVVRIITSTAAPIDVQANFATHTATTFEASSQNTKVVTATTTTIINAPPASAQVQVKDVMIHNVSSTLSNSIQIEIFNGTDAFKVFNLVLSPDEHAQYNGTDWKKYAGNGVEIVANAEINYFAKDSRSFYKVGTAPEALGTFYFHGKDTGFPGAWSPGTPGVNGRITDGASVGDAGCISLGTPASGNWHFENGKIMSTVIGQLNIMDVLWVNTGLVVTTLTAQAIVSPTLPARDVNGTTNGLGIQIGILVTTATTNASAITNMTVSYTNSDGVAGRTATMSSFPGTAVIGTIMKFQLQAGDKGVRSIQSCTLGTSLVTGAVSLFMFQDIASAGCSFIGSEMSFGVKDLGVKLFNGHCLLPNWFASTTTAVTLNGNYYFINK